MDIQIIQDNNEEEEDIALLEKILDEDKNKQKQDNNTTTHARNALQKNMLLKIKVEQLLVNLTRIREEKENTLKQIQEKIDMNNVPFNSPVDQKSYYNFGIPYFKDSLMFPCPRNPEGLSIKKRNPYSYTTSIHPYAWTDQRKSDVEDIVHQILREKQFDVLSKELKRLIVESEKTGKKSKKGINAQITTVQRKITKVDDMTLSELVGSLSETVSIDWYRVAAVEGKHTPQECKMMWNLFIHPSINKGPWKQRELDDLYRGLVLNLRGKDWDDLAKTMATGRSGFQCFVYAKRLASNPDYVDRPWTSDEDSYLKILVENCRVDDYIPWSKISYYMEKRTKKQIYNRWREVHCKVKHGKFTLNEDAVLVAAVQKHGCDFKRVATHLPLRTMRQVRIRYELIMTNCGERWSQAEDRRLLNAIRDDVPFKEIPFSEIEDIFPERMESELKWRSVLLGALGGVGWQTQDEDAALNMAIERLNEVETTSATSNIVYTDKNSQLIDVEFVNMFKKLKSLKDQECVPADRPENNISDIRGILSILGAKLENTNLFSYLISDDRKKLLEQVIEPAPVIKPKEKVKLKTYSRKKKIEPTVEVEDRSVVPIATESLSKPLPYLIPPCLATLITFKSLISQFSYSEGKITKDEHPKIKLWHERFFILFYWASFLSNRPCNLKTLFEGETEPISEPSTSSTKLEQIRQSNKRVLKTNPTIVKKLKIRTLKK